MQWRRLTPGKAEIHVAEVYKRRSGRKWGQRSKGVGGIRSCRALQDYTVKIELYSEYGKPPKSQTYILQRVWLLSGE